MPARAVGNVVSNLKELATADPSTCARTDEVVRFEIEPDSAAARYSTPAESPLL